MTLSNKDLVAFTRDWVDFVAVRHLVVECCNHCTINGTNKFKMYYKFRFSSSSVQVLYSFNNIELFKLLL